MLRVRINTDGDAFADGRGPSEVECLLRVIGGRILAGHLDGTVQDRNGNTCGQWDLRLERSQKEDTDG